MPSTVLSAITVTEGNAISCTFDGLENKLHVWQLYDPAGSISREDFSNRSLLGTATAKNGKINLIATITADFIDEGAEQFQFVLYDPRVSISKILNDRIIYNDLLVASNIVSINDLRQLATIASPSSVVEGTTINVTVSTRNVPTRAPIPWKIISSSMNLADFASPTSLTGMTYVSVPATPLGAPGQASLSITPKTDFAAEGNESFKVQFFKPNVTMAQVSAGTAVPWVTTDDITVTDLTQYATCAISRTPVTEGQPVAITISTQNVLDGTPLFWKIQGQGITSSDFFNLTELIGTCNINKNSGMITLNINRDYVTEGSETFKVIFYKPGAQRAAVLNGTAEVFAESPSITLDDLTALAQITPQPGVTSIKEGNYYFFTVNTTNIPNGTVIKYVIRQMTGTAFDRTELLLGNFSGEVTVTNNKAVIGVTFKKDGVVENDSVRLEVFLPHVTLQDAIAGRATPWIISNTIAVSD